METYTIKNLLNCSFLRMLWTFPQILSSTLYPMCFPGPGKFISHMLFEWGPGKNTFHN